MRTLLLAAFLTLPLASYTSAASLVRPCGEAVKFCHYDPWEDSASSDRDGQGKVSQTGGRTPNSSKG
jgi:hypothetical protein